MPLKNKGSQTITNDFAGTISNRHQKVIETDDRKEVINIVFSSSNIHNIKGYSRCTTKSATYAENSIEKSEIYLRNQSLKAGNANWVDELPPKSDNQKNTIHISTKRISVNASVKSTEMEYVTTLKIT